MATADDELVRIGQFCGGFDLLLRGVGRTVGDVGRNGLVEKNGFLIDHADLLTQGSDGVIPDVHAINGNPPGGDVVEPGQ